MYLLVSDGVRTVVVLFSTIRLCAVREYLRRSLCGGSTLVLRTRSFACSICLAVESRGRLDAGRRELSISGTTREISKLRCVRSNIHPGSCCTLLGVVVDIFGSPKHPPCTQVFFGGLGIASILDKTRYTSGGYGAVPHPTIVGHCKKEGDVRELVVDACPVRRVCTDCAMPLEV